MNSDQGPIPGRVSIVVPIHNRRAMLEHLLIATRDQTYPDVETIIVDDGSDDLDAAIFETMRARVLPTGRVVYVRKPNGGASSARNMGVAYSTGDYLYFLDSDDLIFPNAIADLVAALQASGEAYGLGRIVDIDFSLKGSAFESHQDDPGNILRSIEWCTHAALYRRDTVLALGGFDETLPVGEDTIFQIRVRLAYGHGARCGSFLGVRRRHRHGHLSLNGISTEDRGKFLIAAADQIVHDDLFRRERRIVRFGSIALFLTILARVRSHRDAEFTAAFRAIIDALLHDSATGRATMRWLSKGGGNGRLFATSALIHTARGSRSVIRGMRRLLAGRTLRTDALTRSIDRLSVAIANDDGRPMTARGEGAA